MKLARWLLPVLSLLAVLWFTWRDVRGARTGPGPLHAAHAAVAALAGGANCEGCHAPGRGVAAAACQHCHARIAAQLAAGRGLHGALPAELGARCERCHSEHHGDDAPLIAPHAFARAGVADAARYDHRHVAFTLAGAHTALACARCHPHADAATPPAGGRFLGLTQRCTGCHSDAHAGAFGGDCASCHGQERPFRDAPHFAHAALPLTGAHARAGCAACHPAGSERDVAAARGAHVAGVAALAPRACRDCHADPHTPVARERAAESSPPPAPQSASAPPLPGAPPAAPAPVSVAAAPAPAPAAPGGAGGVAPRTALRLVDTADCARCHAADAWSSARPDAEQHARAGFALLGVHAQASCVACHGDAATPPRWRGAMPRPDDCAACHDSPHRDELLAASAGGCAACHDGTAPSFAGARLSAAQHAAIGFALAPPHAEVACASCHRGATFGERFPGRAADDCRTCHHDPHGGQFAARAEWRQCTACHASTHFRPHGFSATAHAATTFPLDGAHGAVGCDRCHDRVVDGVRHFGGAPRACASCHRDPHAGRFDRPGHAAEVQGRAGCARCHDTAAFAPVAAFDHAAWTGYTLDGAHAQLACAACHAGGGDGPGMPRLGKVAGATCAACHADPHAGQFARDGAVDCARCHTATTWPAHHFDHARDSRFALDATHARLACSACHRAHRAGDAPGARAVVRYRPLGTKCGDCHRLGSDGEVRR